MTVELRRKHTLLATLLFAIQMAGLWISASRSQLFSVLPLSILGYLLVMMAGAAFLTSVVILELIGAVLPSNGGNDRNIES